MLTEAQKNCGHFRVGLDLGTCESCGAHVSEIGDGILQREFVSVSELADFLGVSGDEIKQLVKDNRIPFQRRNLQPVFAPKRIARWLRTNPLICLH